MTLFPTGDQPRDLPKWPLPWHLDNGDWRQNLPAQSPAAWRLPGWVFLAAVLLAVSQIHPVYNPRYVAFSLPALALLAAAGLSWLTRIAGRFPLTHIGTRLAWAPAIVIVVLMGALLARPQWAVRGKILLSQMSQAVLRLTGTMHLIGQWQVHSTVLRLYSRTA